MRCRWRLGGDWRRVLRWRSNAGRPLRRHGDDGYLAALVNFRCVANAVWSTEEAVAHIQAAS